MALSDDEMEKEPTRTEDTFFVGVPTPSNERLGWNGKNTK